MLGHLKGEEFINTLEGVPLPPRRLAHLKSCVACAERLDSLRATHEAISLPADGNIPEPDWNHFRESVRVGLLSRSAQRDSVVRRWTGWSVRPALAWSTSLVLLVCLAGGVFWWHVSQQHDFPASRPDSALQAPAVPEVSDTEAEVAAWGQSGVFEDLASIDDSQVEQVRQLLMVAAQEEKPERR
jgi:hypothetical protein